MNGKDGLIVGREQQAILWKEGEAIKTKIKLYKLYTKGYIIIEL